MADQEILVKRRRLKGIFNEQARHLINNDYHQAAGDKRKEFFKALDKTAGVINELDPDFHYPIREGNIPLLIVVSRKLISIESQMELTKIDNYCPRWSASKSALVRDDSGRYLDKMIYLIFDVEPGAKFSHPSVPKARIILESAGRCGLNIEEGLALVRYCRHRQEIEIIGKRPLYLINLQPGASLSGFSHRWANPSVFSPNLEISRKIPTLIFHKSENGVKLLISRGAASRRYGTPGIPSRRLLVQP